MGSELYNSISVLPCNLVNEYFSVKLSLNDICLYILAELSELE